MQSCQAPHYSAKLLLKLSTLNTFILCLSSPFCAFVYYFCKDEFDRSDFLSHVKPVKSVVRINSALHFFNVCVCVCVCARARFLCIYAYNMMHNIFFLHSILRTLRFFLLLLAQYKHQS